jgi:cell division protein FtsA
VRRCGLEVGRPGPAAARLGLVGAASEDEKDLGVCLVDIGGGTTDIAVFSQGAIRHTAVIPIAGDQITSDIAMALRTPTKDAEDLKVRYGCALRQAGRPPDRDDRGSRHRRPSSHGSCSRADAGRGDRAAGRGALRRLVQAELRPCRLLE